MLEVIGLKKKKKERDSITFTMIFPKKRGMSEKLQEMDLYINASVLHFCESPKVYL